MHPRSAFWGPAARVARTEGTGTVSFTQCHFDSWDCHFDGKKDYPIDPTRFYGFVPSDTTIPVLSDQRIEQSVRAFI